MGCSAELADHLSLAQILQWKSSAQGQASSSWHAFCCCCWTLGRDRALVGIATFDAALHFYSLRAPDAAPQMLVVPEVEDVYAPMPSTLLVPLQEYRQGLDKILDNILTVFGNQTVGESCAGAAIEVSCTNYLAWLDDV